jgi:hypothetical protein
MFENLRFSIRPRLAKTSSEIGVSAMLTEEAELSGNYEHLVRGSVSTEQAKGSAADQSLSLISIIRRVS